MPVLPPEEEAKHDLWFNAKMINVKEFAVEVNIWTQSTKENILKKKGNGGGGRNAEKEKGNDGA